MDKTDLIIELIEQTNTMYDTLVDSTLLDPIEIEGAIEHLQKFREELEVLVE